MTKFKGQYPQDWPEIAERIKAKFNYCCERCSHPNNRLTGHVLTVHHLDNNKSNGQDYNLAVLCQKCHLSIQGRVNIFQTYMFPLSDWFKPHYKGFLEAHHLDSREEQVVEFERSISPTFLTLTLPSRIKNL